MRVRVCVCVHVYAFSPIGNPHINTHNYVLIYSCMYRILSS